MVLGIVALRVRLERAPRPVLEALIDGQDHHLAGAGEHAGVHQLAKVPDDAGVLARVVRQDLLDALAHGPSSIAVRRPLT